MYFFSLELSTAMTVHHESIPLCQLLSFAIKTSIFRLYIIQIFPSHAEYSKSNFYDGLSSNTIHRGDTSNAILNI